MLQVLDAAAVRRWCAAAADALTAARTEIDDLNVYPVPDGTFAPAVALYAWNGGRYKDELKRLD